MKQTMLEHESVFKNQVHELHRLYDMQRNLIDESKGKKMNMSEHTKNVNKRKLLGFLLPNSMDGEGSSSQVCDGPWQNGGDVDEVRDVKVRRKMIDLEQPVDEYLDTDETGYTGEDTICSPFKLSKAGRENGSHSRNGSGSCLNVKKSIGLDLNEPLKWQESEPVAMSRDMYSQYGRNNGDIQGQCFENNRSQNGWMVPEAGQNRTQRNQLHLPSHSVQVFSNNAFQPQSYPTTDHSKVEFSRERAYNELEGRSKNPQVSYDSYVESSVASNTPRLHNDYYRPDFVRSWSQWSSSWENPTSSSHQKSYPFQTNPFMNLETYARADSGYETRGRVTNNGQYQGFSSGSKQPFCNFPSTGLKPKAFFGEAVKSLKGPQNQGCSGGLPWLKPKPPYKRGLSNACFDLNASTNQFMGGTHTEDDQTNASPQKGMQSASYSNNPNMGRAELIKSQSGTKIFGAPISEKKFICKQEHTPLIFHSLCIAHDRKEVNHLVKRELDINLPCDASVLVDQHDAKAFGVDKDEGNKGANFKYYIDLNSCAEENDEDSGLHSCLREKRKARTWIDLEAPPTLESEEEENSSQEKINEETWGLMQGRDENSMNELTKVAAEAIVAISLLSDHRRHPDDAASSSTDAAAKNPLSWFAEIITSCGDDLERRVNGSPETTDFEGHREEYSSGEIDYFETMTLNLQQTKEEDYMPESVVPESLKFDENGINQPRRGQARRGRPKRDFQRDVLPGLSSLSRHEVTEDIQMFGLMKTRDNTSNSGAAARRNTKKKRLVTNTSQPSVCPSMNESVSMVELEDCKLTGWGQATRRPRRQRCPPSGNPQLRS